MSAPIVLSLALLQATAAVSQPAAPVATPAAVSPSTPASDDAKPAEDHDPVICHWISDGGSANFPKKQCHRVSVWAKMARSTG